MRTGFIHPHLEGMVISTRMVPPSSEKLDLDEVVERGELGVQAPTVRYASRQRDRFDGQLVR
jgi:hypothetical protein